MPTVLEMLDQAEEAAGTDVLSRLEEAEEAARPPQPSTGVPGMIQRAEETRRRVERGETLPGRPATRPQIIEDLPRDISGPHIPLPPRLAPVADFLTGTNRAIAWAVDAPINQTTRALRQIGVLATDAGDESEDPDIVRSTFESMGIDVGPVDSLAAEMGEQAVYGSLVGAGILLAAPSLAAARGSSIASQLARDLGQFAQTHPTLLQAAEAAAGAGVPGGEATVAAFGGGEGAQAVGGLAGGIVGGVAGGGLVAGSRRLGEATRATGRYFGDRLASAWEAISGRPRPIRGPGAPIRDPELEAERMVQFAEATMEGDRAAIEQELQFALDRVSPVAQTGDLSANFRKELVKVQGKAEGRETELWDAVPGEIEVDLRPAMREVRAIEQEFRAVRGEDAVPERFLTRIEELNAQIGDPEAEFQPTLDDVRKVRTAINAVARREAAGDAPNEVLLRNLARLRDGLLDSMETALDNAAEGDAGLLVRAREWSRYVNDLFSRGPLSKVLLRSRSGGEVVDPVDTVQSIMRRLQGPRQVRRVAEELSEPQLMARMRTAVEGMFRDAIEAGQAARRGRPEREAQQAGAQAASQFLRRNRQIIDTVTGLGRRLEGTVENANFQVQRLKELENSALAKWTNTTAEAAADRMISGRMSTRQVRDLVKQADRDDSGLARDALKNAVVGALFRRAGAETAVRRGIFTEGKISTLNPQKAQRLLQDSGIREMVQTVLEGDEFSRLTRIINIGARIEAGDEGLMRQIGRGGGSVAARIFGAQVGRGIAQFTGGGTVQTPGITSGVMRNLWDKIFRAGSEPGELVARAVHDRAWEQVLMSKAPTSVMEGRRFIRRMEKVVGAMEAGRQEALSKIEFPDTAEALTERLFGDGER